MIHHIYNINPSLGYDISDRTYYDLSEIKTDVILAILRMPDELEALRDAIQNGRIDGYSYSGDCSCLAGTLAAAAGISDYCGETIGEGVGAFHSSMDSLRERFFSTIHPGHTPDNTGTSATALLWVEEAIAITL